MKYFLTCLVILVLTQYSLHCQTKLSDLQTPFTKYRVSTLNCSKIIHKTGSAIYIPSKAFAVDVSKVDSVTILYREIRTPVETVVHNLRMITQLMGKTYLLESNGMFEIYSLNGKDSVQVHEDRSIVVRLALEKEEVDVTMEGFRYNTKNNNWDSYTNRVQSLFLSEKDDDLWGGGIVETQGVTAGVESFWEEEWLVDSEWRRQDSLRQVAFQTMEVFDFGLYNYDKILDEEEMVLYVPTFVNTKMEEIKSDVYVIYEGINSVIYFSEYNWKTEFTLLKERAYSMFTLDKEGGIYVLKDYPELGEANSEVTFKFEPKSEIPDSRHKLSTLIGAR